MIVIPKQIKYRVIELNYTDNMYLEIGKYFNENKYKLEKNCLACKNDVIILADNDIEIRAKRGDYLLISLEDNSEYIYVERDSFYNYIELKEEE